MTIRLGGGQGFYGDGRAPLDDLLASGIDYLVCEALAELTLAILQKDRLRDESLGYTRDLPLYVASAPPAHVADTDANRPYERRRETLRFFRTGDLRIPRRLGAAWIVLDRRATALRLELPRGYSDRRFILYRL